ncbi:tetraacyldisaccharide 4'-kinase [Methylovorus sp. MM2]|uniref:tetraacyldisaccharide 4'-kinase n=1 Tax=Methylovorus sp. MM2 TaxID=1848038 RepID=UPI0007E04501|nr:tetraacyldisaccharide 4'-kinase [Methylovorus sp. MM2]OAM51864.1 tetraacyldisaccharide 4'-kinase [Methylovorus sp. MM2]
MNTWFADCLQKQWYRRTFWHLFLLPVSWLFRLLSACRRFLYHTHIFKSSRLPVPVIVVGNITVGGTGKTPLVIWMAKQLIRAGYHPAVVSRGYGVSANVISPVYEDSVAAIVGDEPVLMARHLDCPVWVGRDRAAVARKLLQVHPDCDVIISDDGLQHYALQRDIEIVVVDAARGFGNGLLLPAGPLRESEARLKSIDAIVYNGGSEASNAINMHLHTADFHHLLDTSIAKSQDFAQKRIHAIAGIGNPSRFFNTLSMMGLQFESHVFPDHHAFQPEDLQIEQADVILMTEKDAVKCRAFAKDNWWYLPVEAVVDESLIRLVVDKLGNKNG